MWDDEQLDRLTDMVEGYGTIPVAVADQTNVVEHVGEAQPVDHDADGNVFCRHPMLVPNKNRTECVLAFRYDIGRHFLNTGGRTALKEGYERAIGRLLSFNRFILAQEDRDAFLNIPELKALFESPGYLGGAADICDLGVPNPILDPFQLGIIVNIAGQTVPIHLDAPYFGGKGVHGRADRFLFPAWLLVVMQMSGLFEEERVAQVQGVAYMHRWEDTPEALAENGGTFFYYPNGVRKPERDFPARTANAIICDGSIVVHGTDPFKPNEKDIQYLRKEDKNALVFKGNHTWDLTTNGVKRTELKTSDFRISLVWRSRCFRNEEEKRAWEQDTPMELDYILDTLDADLRARGRLSGKRPEPLAFAELLLDEYVEYPMPNALMPVNFCMLGKLMPNLDFLVRWLPICQS